MFFLGGGEKTFPCHKPRGSPLLPKDFDKLQLGVMDLQILHNLEVILENPRRWASPYDRCK